MFLLRFTDQTSFKWYLYLSRKYIKELLKKFQAMDAKPIDTPMGTNSKMDVDDSGPMVNEIVYRLIIGSLLNLMTISRQILCSVWVFLRGSKHVPWSLT